MKAQIKYLITLLLLLTGCDQLFGNTLTVYQKTDVPTAIVVNQSCITGLTILKDNHTVVISPAAPETQKQDARIEISENEIEEEEFLSNKKYVEISNFNSFFSAQPLDYFFCPKKKCSGSCDHLSFISSYRGYLLLQVFRI